VFGHASGFAANIGLASLNGTTGFQIRGAAAYDQSGISVASGGDVNGDGFADLIIGAFRADPHGGSSGASYVVFGKASGFAANIDLSMLNGTTGFKLSGVAAQDYSGQSVASAGDVNGDGFADLIVGAIGADPHGSLSGASYVVFGKGSGFAANIHLSSLDGTTGFKLSGAAAIDQSGASVASAGDVNGDGFADLIVGAPGAAGGSYVVFGAASGFAASIDLSTLDGNTGFKLRGATADDFTGLSVASAGDVNGDGLADLIVGAPDADPHGNSSGASYVVFGRLPDTAVDRTGTDVAQTLVGGDLNDTLSGLGGDDRLYGYGGTDTLDGGADNDTLIGFGGADTLIGGSGSDTASYASSGVGVTVDLGTGTGTGGDAQADSLSGIESLIGSAQADMLTGDGNDNGLDGGGGADTLIGGVGNDSYVVDNVGDVVTENTDEGIDEVRTSLASYSLAAVANVEKLIGTAASGQTLTGDERDNTIIGGIGNDALAGGAGADTLIGGSGSDTASYALSSAGVTVDLATGAGTGGDAQGDSLSGIENLIGSIHTDILTGDANANTLEGGAGADTLIGGGSSDTASYASSSAGVTVSLALAAGIGGDALGDSLSGIENLTGSAHADMLTGDGNDNTLDGGGGADALIGSTGNDTYVVDNAADVVTENADEGTDEVRTSLASYSLAAVANVENLTGTATTGQALTGDGLDNAITAGTGNDTLDGGGGKDTMAGGLGDDTYVVDHLHDEVIENGGQGIDTVNSTIDYNLTPNVENLVLLGSAGLQGYGNSLANVLTGNAGSNLLSGRGGADTMIGGAGDDVYYALDDPGDVVVENANEGADAIFSRVSYTLPANVETLVLDGLGGSNLEGHGNGLANTLYGDIGSNILDGGAGADAMLGGVGNDSYFVDDASDVAFENANQGSDTVFATAHFRLSANLENLVLQGSADLQGYGNNLANMISGNAGDNLLDGGAGADIMEGGSGNDTYFVDNIADRITESANQGTDLVYAMANFRLPDNVEYLILKGSANLQGYGNGLSNLIYGDQGNDVLNGDAGTDGMLGGVGNDAYFVDNIGDIVFESAGEGVDTVYSTIHFRLGAEQEHLVLLGSAGLQGYGNELANSLSGNSGNNILNGDAGGDAMYGNAGNDVYFVDNAGDFVIENAGQGNDTVYASVHYRLTANVDNLILQDNGDLQGYGNGGINALFGNAGNNILNGEGGADAMRGGDGNDAFVFSVGQADGDTVVDFDGQGATVGDSLRFVGYGAGATFTQIDTTHWQVNYSGGALHEIITFTNGAAIDASDYLFV
jgi:Ca2+-binding RTX toxin-like protein